MSESIIFNSPKLVERENVVRLVTTLEVTDSTSSVYLFGDSSK